MNYWIENNILNKDKIFHLKDPVLTDSEYLEGKKDLENKENFINWKN